MKRSYDDTFDDLTLRVGRVTIQANRALLAGCCGYFQAALSGGFRESQQQEVEIRDVKHSLVAFVVAASKFRLDAAAVEAAGMETCLELLQVALTWDFADLRQCCCDALAAIVEDQRQEAKLTQVTSRIE